jgi:hypothetical protein
VALRAAAAAALFDTNTGALNPVSSPWISEPQASNYWHKIKCETPVENNLLNILSITLFTVLAFDLLGHWEPIVTDDHRLRTVNRKG